MTRRVSANGQGLTSETIEPRLGSLVQMTAVYRFLLGSFTSFGVSRAPPASSHLDLDQHFG